MLKEKIDINIIEKVTGLKENNLNRNYKKKKTIIQNNI